ncbi:uncharacterized protein LOC144153948 [Haemaphysalis longicornis]
MSQDSAAAETQLSDRSQRRSKMRRLDAEHSDEPLENIPQALHEPVVYEGQEAFQEATSKEEDEHLRNGEDNPDCAITELYEKVNKTLSDLQERRREEELRAPKIREAFLAKMAEAFDSSLEKARARWDAQQSDIGELVSEIEQVMQCIEEQRAKRETLKRTIASAWEALA